MTIALTHDQRTRLMTELAYAKIYNESRRVYIDGITFEIAPYHRKGDVESRFLSLARLRESLRREGPSRQRGSAAGCA